MTQETRLRVESNPTRGWQANKKTHLCVASGIRAMPETEKPPAMRVDIYFQFYNLVPNLTSKENVELASEIVKDALDPLRVLKDVGLAKRINNFPAQLSGGEQQRVAIARAIAKNPKILLCDEPTGALDYQTGKQVLQILQDMCRKKGATVVIVTHNGAIAPIADRVIHMHDATVKKMEIDKHPRNISEIEWLVRVVEKEKIQISCRRAGIKNTDYYRRFVF